jgi:outer membrane protein insertion porin family
MKAGSKFLNAVSAVALSASVVASGAGVATLISATAAEAAVVQRINVQGASRVGADAVRANIDIVPGKEFSSADIDSSVRRLYATGYFSDVRITVSGGSLNVSVSENELINQVVFNGNRKIKDDKLAGIVQTKSNGAYSKTLIDADIQSIKDAYAAIGRSDIDVTIQTVPVGEGRVNLAFVINEGERTKITSIDFEGNQAYSDGRLASVISTKKSNLLSFLTRKDVYSDQRLQADEEALRQFYFNHGYADFRVISSNATLDPATNEYTLTFQVEEGPRYTFGAVNVESTVEGVNAEELSGLVESREGSTYAAKDVQKTMEAISRRVASAGYPFARVTPRGNRDFQNNTIGVDYLVDQGERAYVERIEIRGNTRSRDYVIRREFDLSEGDAFNQEMISRAKRRLEALGYFATVNISTQPGTAPDRVVIVVDVEDQPTGSFGIGAGYTTGNDGGITIEASVEEKNFLGRGQYIRVAAGGGQDDARSYSLSFTEPYFLGYRLAAGFDIYRRNTSRDTYYDYSEQGVTLRVTAPITEELATTVRYNYREYEYDGAGDWDNPGKLAPAYQNLILGTPWVTSSVSQSLTYNTLDDQNLPREGIFAQITHEYAGLGGDSEFYKISGKGRYFQTLSDEWDLIGSLSVGAGHVVATGDNLNVFDQFSIGGREIRGFESDGIGPRDSVTKDALGGTTYFVASAEASFPLPVVPQDLGFRGAVFADAGTLYGNDVSNKSKYGSNSVDGEDSALRASVGASLIWASPFGPLRVDYAVPVAKEEFDEEQRFRFGISNQF